MNNQTRLATIALVSLSMTGCITTPSKPDAPLVSSEAKPVLIDRYLLEQCDKPSPLSGRDEAVVVSWATDLLSKYRKCYEKNEAHIQLLRNNFPQVQPKD